jgi:hypothetical protein
VQVLQNAGLMALMSMFVPLLPLAMGMGYAVWPNEQKLTLIRVLSLAAIFSAVTGTALGFINELVYMSRREITTLTTAVSAGTAESLVSIAFGFGCLTATWLFVAIGMWRKP